MPPEHGEGTHRTGADCMMSFQLVTVFFASICNNVAGGKQSLRHAVQIVYINPTKTTVLCVPPSHSGFSCQQNNVRQPQHFSFLLSSLYLSLSNSPWLTVLHVCRPGVGLPYDEPQAQPAYTQSTSRASVTIKNHCFTGLPVLC